MKTSGKKVKEGHELLYSSQCHIMLSCHVMSCLLQLAQLFTVIKSALIIGLRFIDIPPL